MKLDCVSSCQSDIFQTWWQGGARLVSRWWGCYPAEVCLVSLKTPAQFHSQRNRKGFHQQNTQSTSPWCPSAQLFRGWVSKTSDNVLAFSSACCTSDDQKDTTASQRCTSRNKCIFSFVQSCVLILWILLWHSLCQGSLQLGWWSYLVTEWKGYVVRQSPWFYQHLQNRFVDTTFFHSFSPRGSSGHDPLGGAGRWAENRTMFAWCQNLPSRFDQFRRLLRSQRSSPTHWQQCIGLLQEKVLYLWHTPPPELQNKQFWWILKRRVS